MKIGILHNYTLSGSGSSTYVLGLVKSLTKLGHEVVVISREPAYEKYGIFRSIFSHDGDQASSRNTNLTDTTSGTATGYTLTFDPYIGIETHPECQDAAYFSTCSREIFNEYLTKSIQAVQDIIRREKIEVLNTNHEVPLPYVAAKVQEITGTPFLATLHGSHIEYVLRKNPDRYRPCVEEGLNRASYIIVTTQDVKNRCIANASVSPESFVLIPVGVDTDLFKPSDAQSSSFSIDNRIGNASVELQRLREESRVVVFVGKVTADKGVHLLPYMLPYILEKNPLTQMLIVGGGDILESLIAFSEGSLKSTDFLLKVQGRQGVVEDFLTHDVPPNYIDGISEILKGHCVITGPQPFEVVQKVLSVADVCVIPSLIDEALPMITLESLSSGALPIARDYSGFREVIARIREEIPEMASTLAIEADTKKLVLDFINCTLNALQQIDDPQRKDYIAQALRNLAVSEYDWQIIASRVVNLYRKAVRK